MLLAYIWIGFFIITYLLVVIQKNTEKVDLIEHLSIAIAFLFSKLFPEITADHPVISDIPVNFSSHKADLYSSATSVGLKRYERITRAESCKR